MRLPRRSTFIFAGFMLIAAQAISPASAQQLQDYSKGKGQFPNLIGPYTGRDVPPPVTSNTARIDQLIHDGKLTLSLDDSIALALENNLDIAIARYNLSIADTDILKAKAGSQISGVNTGLVQGTPGGGVGTTSAGGIGTSTTGATGGGAGGTTAGSGGAGSGTSGLVQSTIGSGPPVGSFDPQITAGLSIEHLTHLPPARSRARPTSRRTPESPTSGISSTFPRARSWRSRSTTIARRPTAFSRRSTLS